MNIQEAEQAFAYLRSQLSGGLISPQDFRNRVNELRFSDANGVWWQIREQDGGWLRWTGAAWVPDTPVRSSPQVYPPPQSPPVASSPSYSSTTQAPSGYYNTSPAPVAYPSQAPAQQQTPYPVQAPALQKNVAIAAVASIWPGLGQTYNGQLGKGIAVFVFVMVLFSLAIFVGIFTYTGFIVWAYGIYDSYSTAKKMNSGTLQFLDTSAAKMIGFIVISIIISFVYVNFILNVIIALLLGDIANSLNLF